MSIAAKCTCGRKPYYCAGEDCPKFFAKKIPPIYGTTASGTETIFDKWVNGNKIAAIKFLIVCININAPKTPNNTENMAKETIEKWFEENFN